MLNHDDNAIREAELLCDKASALYLKEPKEALAMLLSAETLLNGQCSDERTYFKILSRCLSLQSTAYQRLSEFEKASQVALRTLAVAKKVNDYKTIANAFRILGSVAFFKGEYDVALEMYEKGLEQSRFLDDKKSLASLLNNIGTVYHHLSDYARSMNYCNQSLEIRIESGDKRGEANSYTNIGNNYYALGDYANALDYQFKALKTYQEINDEQGMNVVYNGIGLIYERLGEYQKAIENYQNCLKFEERSGNRWSYALTLNNLGNVYASINDYQNALSAYQESLCIKRQILDRQGIAHTLVNIAELYIKQARYDDAYKAVSESLEMVKMMGDKSSQASCLITASKLFAEKKFEQFNLDTALQYLNQAVEIARDVKAKGVLVEAYQALSQIYEQKGDALNALDYYKRFHAAEQEIKSEESEKRIQNLSIAYESEKAKKESELRKLEAEKYRLENVELVKANQFKTELLAIAAHDLKNPLQSIMGFSELILEYGTDETVVSHATVVRRSAERMLNLLNTLLSDAKYEMMNFEMKRETVNLTECIKKIINEQLSHLAAQKSQTLLFELDEEYVVQGDLELLKQIFENLISNAIKYTPKGKSITVRIERVATQSDSTQSAVRVSVQDEGQGLTEDDMKKLFGKFQRLSAKPTGGESSTGLGLSIVKKLVELHSGKIWAESEGKDKGSTFIIELPMQ
ncbi:MAG: tetratricopeptide repeat-containing sensor histidine kinase [Chloroherpetonaceae bacterium]